MRDKLNLILELLSINWNFDDIHNVNCCGYLKVEINMTSDRNVKKRINFTIIQVEMYQQLSLDLLNYYCQQQSGQNQLQ